jgi:hypothetical protein
MININDFLTFYLSKSGNSNLPLAMCPLLLSLGFSITNFTFSLIYFLEDVKANKSPQIENNSLLLGVI